MTSQTNIPRSVSHIVESQMRHWELQRDQQSRRESREVRLQGGQAIKYIAISREMGSGGSEVGQILSQLLNWQLFDKEILDFMSEDMNVHTKVVESIDERTTGWIEEWLTPIFAQSVGQLSYYHHLSKVLMILANHGEAIIVGRAAGLLLPRESGLSIRVIAPMKNRRERIAQAENISLDKAQRKAEKSDKEKRQLVKQFLKKDFDDNQHYDLVINTEKLSPESVAKLIWRTLDQRRTES